MENKKVVVGGTFDLLHDGHKALLKKAFELAKSDLLKQIRSVYIGLVSDEMAKGNKERKIESFEKRQKELEDFIKKEIGAEAKILGINDKFGFAANEDFDYIVVSPETYNTALAINEEREKRGRKPIEIVKIDFVLAEDGKPISSTRIANGEIDRKGKLLR